MPSEPWMHRQLKAYERRLKARRKAQSIVRFAAAYGMSADRLADVLRRQPTGEPIDIRSDTVVRNMLVQMDAAIRAADTTRREERYNEDLARQESERKRREETALQQLQEEVAIEWGEKRDEAGQSSQRVYFFYVTPTGIETGMKECLQVKPKWSKGGNTDFFGNRTAQMGYTVSGPFTMKMVCLGSIFGKPRQRNNIYISVNPSLERIEIVGPEGFGKFTGRGEVDLKASGLTKEQFEKAFTVEVLAARVGKSNKNVRSLIY